jgi:hypothetical protein
MTLEWEISLASTRLDFNSIVVVVTIHTRTHTHNTRGEEEEEEEENQVLLCDVFELDYYLESVCCMLMLQPSPTTTCL